MHFTIPFPASFDFSSHFNRAAPKVKPLTLLCQPTKSEDGVGGMAAEGKCDRMSFDMKA